METCRFVLRKYVGNWSATADQADKAVRQLQAFQLKLEPFNVELNSEDYWKQLTSEHPDDCGLVGTIAIHLLGICVHSMSVERVFSIMGWINSAKRSSMTPDTLSMLTTTCLHWKKQRSTTSGIVLKSDGGTNSDGKDVEETLLRTSPCCVDEGNDQEDIIDEESSTFDEKEPASLLMEGIEKDLQDFDLASLQSFLENQNLKKEQRKLDQEKVSLGFMTTF
jgi:hypothetical protein